MTPRSLTLCAAACALGAPARTAAALVLGLALAACGGDPAATARRAGRRRRGTVRPGDVVAAVAAGRSRPARPWSPTGSRSPGAWTSCRAATRW